MDNNGLKSQNITHIGYFFFKMNCTTKRVNYLNNYLPEMSYFYKVTQESSYFT